MTRNFLLILLFPVTLIVGSQLHVTYAANSGIFSGNQINENTTNNKIYVNNSILLNAHNNMDINNSILQITTDKQKYVPGETVIVTIKNKWKIPLKFPDSLLGLNIENVKTGQKAGLLAAQVISELKPNESKTFHWDQKDINANQAEPGIYRAEIASITKYLRSAKPFTANTTFDITSP